MWTWSASAFIFYWISSNLQVTRTGIKSWTGFNCSHVLQLASELLAFECRKIFGGHDSAFIFDWSFVKLASHKDRHKISDKFNWPDWIIGFRLTCPWKFLPLTFNRENVVDTIALSFLIRSYITFLNKEIQEFLVKIKMLFLRSLERFIFSWEINTCRLDTFPIMVSNMPYMYNRVPVFGLL